MSTTTAIQFGNITGFTGTMTAELVDENGAPANVIDSAKPLTIKVSWTYDTQNIALAGEWRLSSKVEVFGPDPDFVLGGAPTAVSASSPVPQSVTWTVDPNPLSAGNEYKIIVVLRLWLPGVNGAPDRREPVAALAEFAPIAVI